jgi:putative FmdB family regulatory protein
VEGEEEFMPLYEYECRKCKAHIEILQKITDKPLAKCRKCGGRLEKLWSSTSFQLKGTGWYATDYAAKKGDASEEKKPSASESKAESKTTDAKSTTDAKAMTDASKTKKTDSKKTPSSNASKE